MAALTKISIPCSSGIVPRQRTFRLMDEGLRRPVLWVASPGGSGKTSLVASYLEARGLPCLWYKADSGDGDIAAFFYYMGLAARKAAPRFRKPLPLFTPEYVLGIPEFARRFFETLFERLKPPFVIVLDNYHDIPVESQLHEVIKIGLANTPEGINIVVLSRNAAPEAFVRLLANNAMSRLGWEEVRFTEEETSLIVQAREKLALPGETIALLHKKTGGWAAGLMLLIESSKSQRLDAELLNRFTPQEIFGYFATEIFRKSDPQEREFLLATAFLPSMTARTAEALTGNKSAAGILRSLNERNYFTERHLKDRPIYLYHPLFREFLVSMARERWTPEAIAAIQRKAAALLINEGQIEDAAVLLIEAADWGGFTTVFLKQAPVLMSTGRSQTMAEWLGRIPGEIVQNAPWLLYWRGVCRLPVNPEESRRFLEDAFRMFESPEDDAGRLLAWSAIVQSYLFEFDDFRPLDRWIDWLDERVRSGIPFPSPEIEASVAAGMIGALTWRMPAHPGMRQWVERALSLSRSSANTEACMRSYTNAAVYYIWTGMFNECSILIGEMSKKIHSEPISPLRRIFVKVPQAMFYNTAAEFREQSMRAVQEGLEIANETGVRIANPLLYIQGVLSALNEGNPQRAEDFLRKLENVLLGGRTHASHYYFFSAWYHLFTGRTDNAVRLAEKSLAMAEETGVPVSEATIRIVLANALFAFGEPDGAERQLALIETILPRTASAYLEYLYWLTKARFLLSRDESDSGRDALSRAMQTGRQHGFVTLHYFWLPAVMSRLCAEALEAEIEVAYVQATITKLGLVPDDRALYSEQWPRPVKIYAFGRLEVYRDGRPLEFAAKAPRRIIALLRLLVASGKNGMSDERAADLLWPDADGDAALRALATSIHRLRTLLGNEKTVQRRDGRVKLAPEFCWVDAHAFEGLLERAAFGPKHSAPSDDQAGSIEKALPLYRDAFLSESIEPWAVSCRERLREKYLGALARLGGHHEGQGRFEQAIACYQKGLEIDNLVEELYYRAMKCYASTGRRADAITVYMKCRRILQAVLGVEPSPETEELFKSLKAGSNKR